MRTAPSVSCRGGGSCGRAGAVRRRTCRWSCRWTRSTRRGHVHLGHGGLDKFGFEEGEQEGRAHTSASSREPRAVGRDMAAVDLEILLLACRMRPNISTWGSREASVAILPLWLSQEGLMSLILLQCSMRQPDHHRLGRGSDGGNWQPRRACRQMLSPFGKCAGRLTDTSSCTSWSNPGLLLPAPRTLVTAPGSAGPGRLAPVLSCTEWLRVYVPMYRYYVLQQASPGARQTNTQS